MTHETQLKTINIKTYKVLARSVVNPCFKKNEVIFCLCPFNTMVSSMSEKAMSLLLN